MDTPVNQEVLSEKECIDDDPCYGTVEILEYEQRLMLDTMDDDVIFIHGRGLGVERMFLNHLIMYSDQKLLTIVLNTSPHDEAYFLSRLKLANVPCLPKVVNADVSTKDREAVYLEGGVQFLTSRIFLVDLLTDRAPVENVACIMVYHAHQVLLSFQESFILRLYRERKPGGFVKAFTDVPTSISALGQLQRVVDRLYIKRVCLLPRFDADVKFTLEKTPPVFTELLVDLHPTLRRLHTTFIELLKVCIRELKQCSIAEKQATLEEDTINVAAYRPTLLERQLNERRSFLTDKQLRLISDLSLLRELLQTAEDMDPASVLSRINALRNDKEVFERSGSWMMSRVAASLIADVEILCGYGAFSSRPFISPPKWQVIGSVLKEIKNIPVRPSEISLDGPSILLLVNNDAVARQLTDLIKDGPEFLTWLARRSLGTSVNVKEPERTPLWNGDHVTSLSRGNAISDPHKEMVSNLQRNTLVTARAARRRRKAAEDLIGLPDFRQKQTKIVQFGILQYKKQRTDCLDCSSSPTKSKQAIENEKDKSEEAKMIGDYDKASLVVSCHRYSILRQLEEMKPTVIILYNTDIATLRHIEMYKACHSELFLHIYSLMYRESTEESRYLTTLKNETDAFTTLFNEKATLMIPRRYETGREEVDRLQMPTGNDGGQAPSRCERPKIIVDVREFNSELPTVLYKKGYDVVAVTLEVADYVLSPAIAVERKALDDLAQSLQSGRVFKQSEQMLRHYTNSILLIESNRKFESKIVNGGPFQGELSRHCREVRALLCSLLRSTPKLKLIWSLSPANSAEYFAELKLNRPEPDADHAVSLKSDEVTSVKGKESV
ncbi:hypothetical protein Angca_002441 [Angiostrongylus cantonensis]|nr:hypothetical protein Angca_002441 [Angiostrongylus cantonensis]